jgi:DNA polymerase elongation subunit (family B)
MSTVSFDIIESFLEGRDPQKYIVAIESNYNDNFVDLIINDPETGKRIERHDFKPFIWIKQDVSKIIYGGSKTKIRENSSRFGVKIKPLRISDDDGFIPERMDNGYKFLAETTGGFMSLILFFKEGGIDIWDEAYRHLFLTLSPSEQFLIQTGKRLFKGIDDYNGLHKLQFDLETAGLDPSRHEIFQIGVKDNRGFEYILETKGDTPKDRRESEKDNIITFFKIIDELKPDLITAYNSENFDWPFFERRCERLSIDFTKIVKTLNPKAKVSRKESQLKLGQETINYQQTNMWGYNILDISHAVRRAQAINSDIKQWTLKYITKFSKVAKNNRVYVPGDKINSTWADSRDYWFNDENGSWGLLEGSEYINELPEPLKLVKGDYIVQRYLLDDLWETEQVDYIYNQASFLLAKILPTSYMRSSTMGTAGQWKLIMCAWSYENGLGIPRLEPKRDFTGGLSRLLKVGYAGDKGVVKFDFAALYPKTQLTWKIFPNLDITGVMEGLLTYVVDKRDEFKFLTGEHKDESKRLKELLETNQHKLTPERINKANEMITKESKLASDYDKKQLPLKILANSWFGSYGAPYLFPWGDTDSAEETTCRGRQSLRLMVKHFHGKYNFTPLVGDSVTYDTPVYVRYTNSKKQIDVLPISQLFNKNSKFLDNEGLRDYSEKPYEILTRSGWRKINYVYRHETDKNIHRIVTKDRLINVTEDHSLFQNGVEIKPSELNRGDKIDVYDLPFNSNNNELTESMAYLYGFFLGDGSAICCERTSKYVSRKTGEIRYNKGRRSDWKISNSRIEFLERLKEILKHDFSVNGLIKDHRKSSSVYNLVVHNSTFANYFCDQFYTYYRQKRVPKIILNSSVEIKRAFIEGVCASDGYGDTIDDCVSIGMKSQIAMAGLVLLFKELGIEYKIRTRKDKQNFITIEMKNRGSNVSGFTERTMMKFDEVWSNDVISNDDENKYVYDVSTEDGTFICGMGGVIAHNTDGFNFLIPDNINEIKYVTNANHWKTNKYKQGETLVGLDAVLAEFNETFMEGRMGLDIDDIYDASISFKRKNYANKIDGKVKLVGNSIKSKSMPTYIEEFINEGVGLLLDGKGYEFIELYYNTVNKIYNYQIPAIKIASKSKVKMTLDEYKNTYCNQKNKAGNSKSRQAHMELAIKEGLKVDIGDVIYYINTGLAKSHSDIKAVKNKENGSVEVGFNCQLIPQEQIEKNPDLLVEDYNVAKYLEALNKRIESLLVCFDTDIRDRILIGLEKDKKTKITKLQQRSVFTELECKLVSGKPLDPSDQDDYEEDLMKMEDREIKFWMSVNKLPNFMEESEWLGITNDYVERTRIAKEEGIKHEKKEVLELLKRLEVKDYKRMKNYNKLPIKLDSLVYITTDSIMSKKWEEPLYPSTLLFEYEDDANERNIWYSSVENGADNMYDMWLDYKAEVDAMSGDTITYSTVTSNYILGIDTANEGDTEITTFVKIDDDTIEYIPNKNEEEEESEWNF